jgi:hypothetical protein
VTEPLKPSVVEILSWLQEHQSLDDASLGEVAARFGASRDQLQTRMQSLQRHECVKRGGRENAAWSITDHGLVRLAEGRFSRTGGFRSPYDLADGVPAGSSAAGPKVTVITVPPDPARRAPDPGDGLSSPASPTWPSPIGPNSGRGAPALTADETRALVADWDQNLSRLENRDAPRAGGRSAIDRHRG